MLNFRLQTALARQDSIDKKGGTKMSAARNYDSGRIDFLESQNASLQAKVRPFNLPLFMTLQFFKSTCLLEHI